MAMSTLSTHTMLHCGRWRWDDCNRKSHSDRNWISANDAAIVISGKKSKAMRVGDCGVCEERGGVHS